MSPQRGFSLAEAVVVIGLLAVAMLVLVPATASFLDGGRTAAAAREIAITFQSLRWKAVSRGRAHGLLFDKDDDGWFWLEVRDGNGNGLRTAEVRDNVDQTLSGPHRLEDRVRGVTLGFPPLASFPRIPPARGDIIDVDDPIKFGVSDLVSFRALGRSSSGTVYLTDGKQRLFGVVLFGPTGRVRVWRYDQRAGEWRL